MSKTIYFVAGIAAVAGYIWWKNKQSAASAVPISAPVPVNSKPPVIAPSPVGSPPVNGDPVARNTSMLGKYITGTIKASSTNTYLDNAQIPVPYYTAGDPISGKVISYHASGTKGGLLGVLKLSTDGSGQQNIVPLTAISIASTSSGPTNN